MAESNHNKFKKLLAELFMLEQADLDFGIYRIMNAKRDEITRFLDNDLLPQVRQALGELQTADRAGLEAQLKKAIEQAQELGVDPETTKRVKDLRAQLEATADVVALENEAFSDLYNFFRRYYQEGDYLSLRRYKAGVYAIPYEGEEVKLHWANADQYYIKSSEYLRDYAFKLADGRRVHFHIVDADTEQNNNKPANGHERRFILCETGAITEEGGELIIRFEYRPDADKRKQSALNGEAVERVLSDDGFIEWTKVLAALSPTEKNPRRTLLEKHMADYTARYTLDYFIHKDLGGFLRRELDFYIKNEVMHLDDIESEAAPKVSEYLGKIKAIRRIAHKIIEFLAQLENFQKKLWLKKKFVVETNYCVTLDHVPEELYEEVAANDAQREEWVRLFAIDEIEGNLTNPKYSIPLTTEFLKANQFLVLDTQFFSQILKDKFLASHSSLDDEIEAVALHSESFQALQFLLARYRSKIQSIYIDPPYNTDNRDFPYKDDYRHSSWLSMMDSRLVLAQTLLRSDGSIFVQIDYNEASRLKMLLEIVYGEDNFVNEIIWRRKQATSYSRKQLGIVNDTILWFSKGSEYVFNPIYSRDDENTKRYIAERFVYVDEGTNRRYMKSPLVNSLYRPNLRYVFRGINPPPNGWLYSKERMEELDKKGELIIPNDVDARIYRKIYEDTYPGQLIQNLWIDIPIVNPMAKERVEGFATQKPSALVARIFKISAQSDSVLMDFFAGSGTAYQSTLDLNLEDQGRRKCILVEMANYFDTFLLPRIKRLAGDTSRQNPETGHILKYIRLESYEDALNNLELKRTEAQASLLEAHPQMREDYMLSYMLDVESRGSASLLNTDQFEDPFNYKLNISTGSVSETRPVTVDLVETFNYLLGLRVKHIDMIRGFKVAEGRNPNGEKVLIIWRNVKEKPNAELDEFFQKQGYNTRDMEFDIIYVNGDNNLENLRKPDDTWKVRLIEEDFKRLMFEMVES